MQNTSINIPYYTPAEPPDNSDMARYLREELFKVRAAIDLLAGGKLPVTAVEPTKPRDGDIKIADGINWNPTNSGKGAYVFFDGEWHQLLANKIRRRLIVNSAVVSQAVPTSPTVFIWPNTVVADSQYDSTTGVITFADDCEFVSSAHWNITCSSGQKTFFADAEFFSGGVWVRGTRSMRIDQARNADGTRTVVFPFAGGFLKGTLLRFVMWGDAGITIDTVSNQGSTSPAARLTYECIKCIEI